MSRHFAILAICAIALVAGVRLSTAQATDSLVVRDAWVRAVPASQPNTVAYLVIEKQSDRATALVAVEGQAAETFELHAMQVSPMKGMQRNNGASDGARDEMMSMVKVAEVPVPAKARTELKPGGFPVMLFKLRAPVTVGVTLPLTLRFSNGAAKSVIAKVLPLSATSFDGNGK